jgi:hypothetical protein
MSRACSFVGGSRSRASPKPEKVFYSFLFLNKEFYSFLFHNKEIGSFFEHLEKIGSIFNSCFFFCSKYSILYGATVGTIIILICQCCWFCGTIILKGQQDQQQSHDTWPSGGAIIPLPCKATTTRTVHSRRMVVILTTDEILRKGLELVGFNCRRQSPTECIVAQKPWMLQGALRIWSSSCVCADLGTKANTSAWSLLNCIDRKRSSAITGSSACFVGIWIKRVASQHACLLCGKEQEVATTTTTIIIITDHLL